MIVFDLREEVRLLSLVHLVGGLAVVLGLMALAPRSLRSRLPEALAEALRPLALVFAAAAAVLLWGEVVERRNADDLVAQCLRGGCGVAEGLVTDVEPVRQITSGGRFGAPTFGGSFRVGGTAYAHHPAGYSDYSPANALRDGDRVRVYSVGGTVVLVERQGP